MLRLSCLLISSISCVKSRSHLLNDSRSIDSHISLSAVECNHQIIGVVCKTLQQQTNHRWDKQVELITGEMDSDTETSILFTCSSLMQHWPPSSDVWSKKQPAAVTVMSTGVMSDHNGLDIEIIQKDYMLNHTYTCNPFAITHGGRCHLVYTHLTVHIKPTTECN